MRNRASVPDMKPSTPKTKLPPSTQPQRAVLLIGIWFLARAPVRLPRAIRPAGPRPQLQGGASRLLQACRGDRALARRLGEAMEEKPARHETAQGGGSGLPVEPGRACQRRCRRAGRGCGTNSLANRWGDTTTPLLRGLPCQCVAAEVGIEPVSELSQTPPKTVRQRKLL